MNTMPSLSQIGWRPFFQQQLTLDELSGLSIGRVVEQHRSGVVVLSEQGQFNLTQPPSAIHSNKRLRICMMLYAYYVDCFCFTH